MNNFVSSFVSGLPRGRRLGRAIRYRWPVLAAATVAAMVPVVALASGSGSFTGNSSTPAVTAYNPGATSVLSNGSLDAEGGFQNAIYASSAHDQTVEVENTGWGDGINAHSYKGHALRVTSETEEPIWATGKNSSGAFLESKNGAGVFARGTTSGVYADGPTGVYGQGTQIGVDANGGQIAVRAISQDRGVLAQSTNGDAVIGTSTNGQGVFGFSSQKYGGEFLGGTAPIRLRPGSTIGAPTTGTHQVGEFYVDSNGDLFFCKVGSSSAVPAGTWKKLT